MLWSNFILGLNYIFLCFKLIIIPRIFKIELQICIQISKLVATIFMLNLYAKCLR